MQNVFVTVGNYGVTSVVTALSADNDIGLFGEKIDDLPFSFIAPLGANHNRVGHEKSVVSCQDQQFDP